MHAATIFISAFLLFQVQPLIARYILPWYGGSPAVWSTCMLFFQVGLLVGYTYAHALSSYLKPQKQVWVHLSLLLGSLLLLPITPGEHLKPVDGNHPALGVILLLLSTVGIPYMLISSTGPLLQKWFGLTYPTRSPYRLYSLSNIGSLLGLITYPFLVEPNFPVSGQTVGWSWGYGLFVLCCAASGLLLTRISAPLKESVSPDSTRPANAASPNPLLWLCLSASGSVLLLSATNFVCQNVAVIPFLWVLPLALYLISFIITFDNATWYLRRIWLSALLIIIPIIFYFLVRHYNLSLPTLTTQLFVYVGGMFIACMVCHGELYRLKPATTHLTKFYLSISLGGAMGGVFVTFVAPQLFSDYWEFPLAFIFVFVLGIWLVLFSPTRAPALLNYRKPAVALALLVLTGLLTCQFMIVERFHEGVLATKRNFYGVLRVLEDDAGTDRHRYKLYHGGINHGIQSRVDADEFQPMSYYAEHSGAGIAFRRHPIRLAQREGSTQGLHVGIIGLGAGALGAYQNEYDTFRYYELNPDVETLARDYFTYLEHGDNRVEVILGDARISMERELQNEGSQNYDILIVDAFSGDAIPIHLLTTEAFELYQQHLKPDGILAIHISNKFFDLRPLIYGTSEHFQMQPRLIVRRKDSSELIKRSTWGLLTNNEAFLNHSRVKAYVRDWPEDIEEHKAIWTDDSANVLSLIKD